MTKKVIKAFYVDLDAYNKCGAKGFNRSALVNRSLMDAASDVDDIGKFKKTRRF